jgi:hypothetical protein
MIVVSVLYQSPWLQIRRPSRTGSPQANLPTRRRSRLYLEPLEYRYVPSTVTNLTDHDPGSLRDAIATTPAGGTVDFQQGLSGTITLTSGSLAITKDLTIAPGIYLTGPITVSGNHTFQVFNIAPSITVTISRLTIGDGAGVSQGDGIYNAGALTLDRVMVLDNSADTGNSEGAGIFNNSSGSLTINSSTISGNGLSFGQGAGVCNYGTLRMGYCIVSGNRLSGGAGAGIYNGGMMTIDGGGIKNGGTLTINSSMISGNGAYYGGGISSAGTLTVSDSTMSGNSAEDGGGMAVDGAVSITNSVLSNNFADFACALLIDSGNVTVMNSAK